MGQVSIPYYVVKKGRGFWQPTPQMVRAGAKPTACGKDGPIAWGVAQAALDAWRKVKEAGERDDRPAAKPGTLRKAFEEYKLTDEWLVTKTARTREEWERCWRHIGPAFGDSRPSAVTMPQISKFRGLIEANISLREAHRCIKIWRALWKVAASLKYCDHNGDPSKGITNVEPKIRNAIWDYREAVKLAKEAWRMGYKGLCAAISVTWDTQMSPVDVRHLTPSKRTGDAFGVQRGKTGREAIGTLTRRSVRILAAYQASFGAEVVQNAPILRNRSGRAYSKDTLGDDFRDVRAAVFGPYETRTMADFRRSGTVEALRGGASKEQIGTKLGNSFASNAFLQKTYAPTDLETAKQVDAARRRGRKSG